MFHTQIKIINKNEFYFKCRRKRGYCYKHEDKLELHLPLDHQADYHSQIGQK